MRWKDCKMTNTKYNWIWIKENDFKPSFCMAEFKNTYTLTEKTKIKICADTRYELYVNGKFIGRGPSSPGGDFLPLNLTYSWAFLLFLLAALLVWLATLLAETLKAIPLNL